MNTQQAAHWAQLFAEADRIGRLAGERAIPTPMTVVSGPLANGAGFGILHAEDQGLIASGERHTYCEPEGACGFAWLHFAPATQPIVKWLRMQPADRRGHRGHPTGWDWAIFDHNQSLARKSAHAEAMAAELRKHGVEVYAESRLD